MLPSRSASVTSPLRKWSSSHRRATALRSTGLLLRTRSSSVTNGRSSTSISTLRRTTWCRRSMAGPVVDSGSRVTANSARGRF